MAADDLCPGCGRMMCRCPSLEEGPFGQWRGDRAAPEEVLGELPTIWIRRREPDSYSVRVPYSWRWVTSGIDGRIWDTARKVWVLPTEGVIVLRARAALMGISVVDVTDRVEAVLGGGRRD